MCSHSWGCEQTCRPKLMSTLLGAVGETRFASNFIMLESLVKTKRELQQTVVSEKWDAWVERGDNRVRGGAEACKAAVMDDRRFANAANLVDLGRSVTNCSDVP